MSSVKTIYGTGSIGPEATAMKSFPMFQTLMSLTMTASITDLFLVRANLHLVDSPLHAMLTKISSLSRTTTTRMTRSVKAVRRRLLLPLCRELGPEQLHRHLPDPSPVHPELSQQQEAMLMQSAHPNREESEFQLWQTRARRTSSVRSAVQPFLSLLSRSLWYET